MAKRSINRKYYNDPFLYAERREEIISKTLSTNSKAWIKRYRKMLANLDRGYSKYTWWRRQEKTKKAIEKPEAIKYSKGSRYLVNAELEIQYSEKNPAVRYTINANNLVEAAYKISKFLNIEEKMQLVNKIIEDIKIDGKKTEIVDDSDEGGALAITNQYGELIDYVMKSGRIPYRALDRLRDNTQFKTELIQALIREYNKGDAKEAFRKASEEFTELMKGRGMPQEYIDKIYKNRYVKF